MTCKNKERKEMEAIAPNCGLRPERRGKMENNNETREQTMRKIEYNLPKLTDAQLRMVSAFIRGIRKGSK